MVKGDFQRAERLAHRAMREGDASPKLKRQWIQAINQQGKQATALTRARKAIQAHPEDPALHQLYIRLEASAGRPGYGLKLANLALRKWPKSTELKLLRLSLLQELGRTREALSRLRQLRQQEFDNPSVLMAIARFYRSYGRRRAALTVIKHLLILQPENHHARMLWINLIQETAHLDITELLPTLLVAVRNNPNFSFRDAAELLQVLKLTTDPAFASACWEALELLYPLTNRLPEKDQLALFIQAERCNHNHAAHCALSAILTSGPRVPMVASTLFNKTMGTLSDNQSKQLAQRLLKHIPQSQHATLQAQFAQQAEGPPSCANYYSCNPKATAHSFRSSAVSKSS
ncbi:hypothetical protein [Cobetia sp. QF-1]|uniref:hypothetical protein n=1 Tax=Cobetia sp. QF-1 TaxID=1969833 RepID=UPI00159503DF|nr:hypothetical protein [Cobetia sp. QF-1]